MKFKELNVTINSSYNECLSELNLKKDDNESDLKMNVKNLQKKYKKILKEDKKRKMRFTYIKYLLKT